MLLFARKAVNVNNDTNKDCSWKPTHDDDGVVQDGGHTPANRLTETYSQLTPFK